MRSYTELFIQILWPKTGAAGELGESRSAGALMERVRETIRALQPVDSERVQFFPSRARGSKTGGAHNCPQLTVAGIQGHQLNCRRSRFEIVDAYQLPPRVGRMRRPFNVAAILAAIIATRTKTG